MMARAFIHINGEKTCILYYVLMNAFIALYYVINFISLIAQEKQAFGWGNLAINGKLLYNPFFLGGGGAIQPFSGEIARAERHSISEVSHMRFQKSIKKNSLLRNVEQSSYLLNIMYFSVFMIIMLYFFQGVCFPTVGENDIKHFTTAFRLRAKITLPPGRGVLNGIRNSKLDTLYYN